MNKIIVRRTLSVVYELTEDKYPGMNIREIREYEQGLELPEVMELFEGAENVKAAVDIQIAEVKDE